MLVDQVAQYERENAPASWSACGPTQRQSRLGIRPLSEVKRTCRGHVRSSSDPELTSAHPRRVSFNPTD